MAAAELPVKSKTVPTKTMVDSHSTSQPLHLDLHVFPGGCRCPVRLVGSEAQADLGEGRDQVVDHKLQVLHAGGDENQVVRVAHAEDLQPFEDEAPSLQAPLWPPSGATASRRPSGI